MGEAADDLHDLQLRQSRHNHHGESTVSKFIPKPGSFTLFDNIQNKSSEKAPDYKGELVWLDGSTFELAIWIKQGQNGEFYSGSFKRKDGARQAPPPPPPAADPSEDAPF